jgi:NADPH:quinone reductase-like Zn-dependent oxidoreductase
MSARAERENRCLSLGTVGSLNSLELIAAPRPTLGPFDVMIEVSAAALNFKEVLSALGLSQQVGDAHAGRALRFGLECAGTIVACGEAVTNFAPGDAVLALGDSCFASYVTTSQDRVARIPSGWSFAAAATLPIAFLTARYALFRIGRLRRGERVLIHAATGGVGLAAVQLCQQAGAEIFATAGTEEKRAYLRSLGIPHVLDSRQLSFADEVRARTGGRGVDVVLNSLSGEFVEKGVQALAPFGRFLELGKRDVYAEMPLNLRWLEKGISFSVILFGADSPDLAELFVEVLAQCERGELQPLPYTIFPASEAASAFTLMARAAHTGRVLLAFRQDAAEPRPTAVPDASIETHLPMRPSLVDQTHALSAKEGIAAFTQALASGLSQVIVSTLPLANRLQGAPAQELSANAASAVNSQAMSSAPMRTFPRPALSNSYVAPRSEIEQTLCRIWQSFLGIEPIGVEDSFESLGGD